MRLITEYLALTTASAGLELLLDPTRFYGSLLIALVLASSCLWCCWRVGRLFSLAYHPGIGNAVLALLAATSVFGSVISLTAVNYTRSLISVGIHSRLADAKTLTDHTPEVCRTLRASFPSLKLAPGEQVTLDCESPSALDGMRTELGSQSNRIHSELQDRLRWNQFLSISGMMACLGICFFVPSWSASRALVVHVGKYRR